MSNKIPLEVSARHVHLSARDLEVLFGKGAVLHKRKDLSQPGQYACEERVEIVGPKGSFKGVSVLGPVRPETQVEVSLADARAMGISVPIRESGQLEGSAGCTIVGPAGEVEIQRGLIAAKRHIHMEPEDAETFGVVDKQVVCVRVDCADRPVVFENVAVRVSDGFKLAMHIDTDEAHACGAVPESCGELLI